MIDFAPLLQNRDGLDVYNAGLPRFPRNFTRDGIITALLAADADMMRGQLEFCALHQGKTFDPITGEEPGKIHHEWPGYPIRELFTTYNACDAAAFFLIGHNWLQAHFPDDGFVAAQARAIQAAAEYIERHLNQDQLFEESPRYSGAEHFALRVTYW
ncbi:MAG: hypothetical protein AAGD96_19210, partial [Chloroflexota bacterium]